MTNTKTLEQLFEEAVDAIPYETTPTSYTQGSLDEDSNHYIEYSEEFTFPVGQLLDQELTAGGWVEFYQDEDKEISISGCFGVARNDDWENGRIFPEGTTLQGSYNIKQKKWDFWIDQY